MRVLLSGGVKTSNIITSIEKKFESSGDDLFVIEYIEDIDAIFAMGNYFDKAIIAEQSITHDGRDVDEDIIRQKLNNFSKSCARRGRDESFVFLTGNEDLAGMINDETLEIHEKSAIVLKPGPYKTKFFALLITVDIPNIPDDMLYHPPVEFGSVGVVEDIPDLSGISDTEIGDMDEGYHLSQVNDFDDLFDNNNEFGGGRISDDFTPDFGEEFVPDEGDEFGDEYQGDFEGNSDFDDFDMSGSNGDSEFIDDTPDVDWDNQDQVIDTDPIEEGFAPSGEIPDYIMSDDDMGDTAEDTDMDNNWGNNSFGFGGGNFEDSFEDDFGSQPADDGFGFGNDEFGSGGFGEQPVSDGFSFSEDEFNNDNFGSQQVDDGYNFGNNQGYGDSEYQDGYNDGGYTDGGYQDEYVTGGYDTGYQEESYPQPDQQYGYNDDDLFDYGNNQQNNQDMSEAMMGAAAVGAMAGMGMMQNNQNNYNQNNYNQQMYNPTEPVYNNQGVNDHDMFDQSNYRNDTDENTQIQLAGNGDVSDKELKKKLEAFAARGNSICVTGCGGCGTSTVAFNLANVLANIGYSVLLVDFDTEGRTQNYISSDCYKSMDPDGANLMAAVNSGQGINVHTSVVKRGLHLLTMGIGGDAAKPEDLLNEAKISRFINLAKPSHNFVIYDVPFDSATGFLSEAVYLADNLVLVTEMNTHGVMKTMLKVCNIDSQDMQDTFFSKAQLVFNKYRNFNKLLGQKVKTAKDITKIMDDTVYDLIGEDNGLYFSSMHIAGILEDDPNYEYAWFEKVQYSDTAKGKKIYKDLIEKIITHK